MNEIYSYGKKKLFAFVFTMIFILLMVWVDYSMIWISDPIWRRISDESALNQRRFCIFGIQMIFGSDSAPDQRRIRADLVFRNVV